MLPLLTLARSLAQLEINGTSIINDGCLSFLTSLRRFD